jgi:hypothetical protein
MLYNLLNADLLNDLNLLNLLELRSIFLPDLKSGGIGIDITHNTQDTAVPCPYNKSADGYFWSVPTINHGRETALPCRKLVIPAQPDLISSPEMTLAKTQGRAASGTFDGEAGDRSIPIFLYCQLIIFFSNSSY